MELKKIEEIRRHAGFRRIRAQINKNEEKWGQEGNIEKVGGEGCNK